AGKPSPCPLPKGGGSSALHLASPTGEGSQPLGCAAAQRLSALAANDWQSIGLKNTSSTPRASRSLASLESVTPVSTMIDGWGDCASNSTHSAWPLPLGICRSVTTKSKWLAARNCFA